MKLSTKFLALAALVALLTAVGCQNALEPSGANYSIKSQPGYQFTNVTVDSTYYPDITPNPDYTYGPIAVRRMVFTIVFPKDKNPDILQLSGADFNAKLNEVLEIYSLRPLSYASAKWADYSARGDRLTYNVIARDGNRAYIELNSPGSLAPANIAVIKARAYTVDNGKYLDWNNDGVLSSTDGANGYSADDYLDAFSTLIVPNAGEFYRAPDNHNTWGLNFSFRAGDYDGTSASIYHARIECSDFGSTDSYDSPGDKYLSLFNSNIKVQYLNSSHQWQSIETVWSYKNGDYYFNFSPTNNYVYRIVSLDPKALNSVEYRGFPQRYLYGTGYQESQFPAGSSGLVVESPTVYIDAAAEFNYNLPGNFYSNAVLRNANNLDNTKGNDDKVVLILTLQPNFRFNSADLSSIRVARTIGSSSLSWNTPEFLEIESIVTRISPSVADITQGEYATSRQLVITFVDLKEPRNNEDNNYLYIIMPPSLRYDNYETPSSHNSFTVTGWHNGHYFENPYNYTTGQYRGYRSYGPIQVTITN